MWVRRADGDPNGGPPRRFPGWLPATLIVLSINLAMLLGVEAYRPRYLRDYRLNENPDAIDYVRLGRNLVLRGCYSRCIEPPYVPDVLRTPVYPIFVGVLDALGGAGAIYIVQAALQAGSCVLLYQIVQRRFGTRPAIFASLFLATDLMVTVSNFEAMSEPLFSFLVLAAIATLGPWSARPSSEPDGRRTLRYLIGGFLLALATLTRPVGLYLIPLFALQPILGLAAERRRSLSPLLGLLAFLAGSLVPVGLWMTRNSLLFGIPRLTTVDTQNVVYFFGSGAYQLCHGSSLQAAQSEIAAEFAIPPYEVLQNPWIQNESVSAMDAQVRSVRWRVLGKYPRELVVASMMGVVKAGLSHNVGLMATLLEAQWNPPSAGAIMRGDPKAAERLSQNGPLLAGALCWEMFHTLLVLTLATIGIGFALTDAGPRRDTLVLLFVLLYFEATLILFGLEAYSRCRLPALPFLEAFAGIGAARFAWRGLGRTRDDAQTEGAGSI
jgi:4-amino-4-deoxy-L-arabinose transferase-like glycosyltransferase